MIPDLGRYAFEVMLAYGITLGLVGGLVASSVLSARKARRRLGDAERKD